MRLVRFKRILDRWEEELYSVGAIKFGKLLMVIFLSAHWVACAWYSVGVDEDSGLVDSDGSKIMGWVTKKFDGTVRILHRCQSACTRRFQLMHLVELRDQKGETR